MPIITAPKPVELDTPLDLHLIAGSIHNEPYITANVFKADNGLSIIRVRKYVKPIFLRDLREKRKLVVCNRYGQPLVFTDSDMRRATDIIGLPAILYKKMLIIDLSSIV